MHKRNQYSYNVSEPSTKTPYIISIERRNRAKLMPPNVVVYLDNNLLLCSDVVQFSHWICIQYYHQPQDVLERSQLPSGISTTIPQCVSSVAECGDDLSRVWLWHLIVKNYSESDHKHRGQQLTASHVSQWAIHGGQTVAEQSLLLPMLYLRSICCLYASIFNIHSKIQRILKLREWY